SAPCIGLGRGPQTWRRAKSIRFVYDEFLEYIIARSWVEELVTPSKVSALEHTLQEIVNALNVFQPSSGALIFLDKMLGNEGALVNKAVKLMSSPEYNFIESQQIMMLHMFENISVLTADNELLDILDRFERIATDDIKTRLTSVILLVLSQHL